MSKCIFEYMGHAFESEVEYNDFISKGGIQLYKKYGSDVFNRLDHFVTLNLLEEVAGNAAMYQDKYKKAKENAVHLDGEEDLQFEAPYIGVISFLRGLTTKDDKLLTPEFREIEYWKNRIASWKDPNMGFNDDEIELFGNSITITDSVSEDELKLYLKDYEKGKTDTTNLTLLLVKLVKEKWEALAKIGTAIHDVLRRLFSKIQSGKNQGLLVIDLSDDFLINTYFNSQRPHPLYNTKLLSPELLKDTLAYARKLKKDLHKLFGANLSFLPEFLIATKLPYEVPEKGDTILGIIDLLVVDAEGNAHVIDYKATPKDLFNTAKERGFWYQLGFYNRMLLNANIRTDSKTPKVMIAPIKMEGFRKEGNRFVFDRVVERDADILKDITINSTLNDVARNIDEFLPPVKKTNITPESMLQSINKFETTSFPNISTSKTWTDEEIKKLIENSGGFVLDTKTNKYTITIKNSNIKPFTADSESELFDKVKEFYTDTLPKKRKDMVASVIIALRKGIKEETNEIELPKTGIINTKEGSSPLWFKNLLGKYCTKEYEIIENEAILLYGIVLIRNKGTEQIDVLQITSDNLDFEHNFSDSNKRRLLTGAFELDTVQSRKPNSLALVAKNGNIHLMEIMAVLNCIPNLTDRGGVIGEILVANPHSLQGMSASNEELIYNFNELSSHIEGFQNNINKLKFASKVLLANNRFKLILSLGNITNWEDNKYKFYKNYIALSTELDKAISEADRQTIYKSLDTLRLELERFKPAEIHISLDTYNETENIHRSLYNKVLLAMAEIKGYLFRQLTEDNKKYIESMDIFRNGVQSLMLDNPGNLNNETLNLLTKLVTEAYLNVREDLQREMITIRELVNNLKNDKNFSKVLEMTGGNASNLFKNMIEYKDGDILFKDPWDPRFAGTESEKAFLKYALVKINDDRFLNAPEETREQYRITKDPKYFRVPLAVGDFSSQAALLGSMNKAFRLKLKRLNPKDWWDEVQKKLRGVFTDVNVKSDETKLFEMNNMFDTGETELTRKAFIAEKGYEYFENNLETLLLKHSFAYSTLRHINTVMPMAKAAMIHLIVLGHTTNKEYKNSTNYVSDYIKNKVKNESLVEGTKANIILAQLRQAASFLMLAFSPVQYGYLVIQGLWTDLRLYILDKEREDATFTLDNFKFAASKVYREMFKLGGTPTKCSLLNEFYGINDMDMNTYADKIKSDKYGIYNMTNLAFHCASRPDFFNRMTLIVALMKADGVWDAYSMDHNKELKYDWKKDLRFSAYANNDKSDIKKYNELKGLYYAMAELLEKEHAMNLDGTYFKTGQPLPKAYTNLLMEGFKSLSDDIYGYYSHEKKSMVHALSLGAMYMQMKTFLSGKKNQYLGRSGVRLQGKYVQLKDSNGNLLYQKEENGKLIPTTENTGVPLFKWEGQWLEGILLTMANLWIDGRQNGFKTTFEDMWYNEDANLRNLYRANIKLLAYDLIMFAIVGTLLTGVLQDWDKELTKEAKESGDVSDAAIAAAAHMAMKMVSSSFGDFNFIESIGMPLISWQPVSLSFLSRRVMDVWNAAFGDGEFKDVLIRSFGVTSNSKIFWDTLLSE